MKKYTLIVSILLCWQLHGKEAAIIVAAQKGSVTKVAHMLHTGADVNTVDTKGNTPLMIAVEQGNLKLVQMLLKAKGVNLYHENNQKQTAFDLAKSAHEKVLVAGGHYKRPRKSLRKSLIFYELGAHVTKDRCLQSSQALQECIAIHKQSREDHN